MGSCADAYAELKLKPGNEWSSAGIPDNPAIVQLSSRDLPRRALEVSDPIFIPGYDLLDRCRDVTDSRTDRAPLNSARLSSVLHSLPRVLFHTGPVNTLNQITSLRA